VCACCDATCVYLCICAKQGKRDPLRTTIDNLYEGGESTIEYAMSTLYTATGLSAEADQLQVLEVTTADAQHRHGTQLFAYYVQV
jgi:hypothetical protein